jgi:hypothetical protein
MREELLDENPGYDDLADRYDFRRAVIKRLAKRGIIVGGCIGRRGMWLTTADHVLHEVEGRQAPLVGDARDAARKKPLTTEDLERILKKSQYTIREMLKSGELPGWRLKIPEHLQKAAGKKVCERWYVDRERLKDYRRKVMEESMRRRFGINASDWDSHISGVG